jgi:hypothetical protein
MAKVNPKICEKCEHGNKFTSHNDFFGYNNVNSINIDPKNVSYMLTCNIFGGSQVVAGKLKKGMKTYRVNSCFLLPETCPYHLEQTVN